VARPSKPSQGRNRPTGNADRSRPRVAEDPGAADAAQGGGRSQPVIVVALVRTEFTRHRKLRPGSSPSLNSCRGPAALANRGSGHRGRASPTGQAGDHRRQASSTVIPAGRAPDVP
jgi:hypothetical protein